MALTLVGSAYGVTTTAINPATAGLGTMQVIEDNRAALDTAVDALEALIVGGDLPVANGGTGANTAAGARTNLGVDAAGTDNSTNVTVSGTPDYITLSGQDLIRALIDLTSHVTGTLPVTNGGTGQTTAQAAINALTAVSGATNEHVLTKDTGTGNAVWKASTGSGDHGGLTGLADDDHTQYSLISSGAGAPGTTPSRVGLIYVDTTSDEFYISRGTASSADWGTPKASLDANGLLVKDSASQMSYTAMSGESVIDMLVNNEATLTGVETLTITNSADERVSAIKINADSSDRVVTLPANAVNSKGDALTNFTVEANKNLLLIVEIDGSNNVWFGIPEATASKTGVYRTVWIDAGAMVSRTTNGAEAATEEYATNDLMSDHFLFDGSTEEGVQFRWVMPDEWDKGTIKAKFFYDVATGASAADGVTFGLSAQALSNDDAIDNAFGASVDTDDTVIAVGDLHVSPASAAVTVSGTPALGDVVWFEITRVVGDANDDMTEDAKLFGVQLQYKESTTEPSVW